MSSRSSARSLVGLVLLGVMLLVNSSIAQNDAVTVRVSVDRDTVGLDEYITLAVEVSGSSRNLPAPKLPTLSRFELYSQGRSSNISISNGVVSSVVTYRYMLLPKEPGTFPIKDIWVVHKNRRYVANSIEITVLNKGTATSKTLEDRATDPKGTSKDYFLQAEVDNRNPYINEQVTLTLKIYIGVKIFGSPSLTEPSLTGFWHEVLGSKAPYYQKIGNRNYSVIERKYALFPTQTGALTIGRAAIIINVANQINKRTRDPFGSFFDNAFGRARQVTMRSQPIDIKVKPLPTAGRPRDFGGTIGKFIISADVDKREVEVNQPVTLTIKINGVGNVKSVAEPKIGDLKDFRVYRASSNESISKLNDKIGGTKTFEEVFIPRRPGKLEIPSLSFDFFDPRTGKYKIVRTRAIKINVTKPEGFVLSPDQAFASPELSVGSQAADIRYIKQEIGDLVTPHQILLTSPLYVSVNAAPILVMIGMIAYRRRRERLSSDIGYARARGASSAARKRLVKARSLASVETAEGFCSEIAAALVSYVADKLNISAHGLTSEQLADHLAERGASEELIGDLRALLRECDFVRFAPGKVTAESIESILEKAGMIMTQIEDIRFA